MTHVMPCFEDLGEKDRLLTELMTEVFVEQPRLHRVCLKLILRKVYQNKMHGGYFQGQDTGMLPLYSQILIWVSVSGEKDPRSVNLVV